MDSKKGIRLRILGAITSHPTHPKPTSPKLRMASPFRFCRHFSYKPLNAHSASSRLHQDDEKPGFPSHINCKGDENDASLFSSSQQCTENFSKNCLNPFSVMLLFRTSTAFFNITISSNRCINMPSVTLQFETPSFFSLLLKYPTAFLSNASPSLPIAAAENVPPEQFTSVNTHELPISSQNLRTASMVLSVNRLLFLKFNTLKRFNDEGDAKRLSTNASSTSQLDAFNLSTRTFLVLLKHSTNLSHPF